MKKSILFVLTLFSCNLEQSSKSVCENSCSECSTGGYLDCKEVCDDINEAAALSGCLEPVDDYFYCLKINSISCLTSEECSQSRNDYLSCVAEYCFQNKDPYLCNN